MSRLIDADRLCEDLLNRWRMADNRKEELIKQVMADIVTPIVVSQPTVNQWIPCSERLPDVGRILISDGNQVLIGGYHGNNTWSIDGCEYDPILENIAWMPLPEPWKGEEE